MTAQRAPEPSHIARCRACGCAASRVVRRGAAYEECWWCGLVHFADGRLSRRRVMAVDPPRPLAPGVAGDITRAPW